MTDSITPPQDLRDKWLNEAPNTSVYDYLIDRAAQWGSDQELEACCQWLAKPEVALTGKGPADLRAARRPKPPSLREQALTVLEDADLDAANYIILLRAIEALPDD